MEWLLIALVGSGGVFMAKRWRERRTQRGEEQAELEGVRRLDAEISKVTDTLSTGRYFAGAVVLPGSAGTDWAFNPAIDTGGHGFSGDHLGGGASGHGGFDGGGFDGGGDGGSS